MAADLKKGIGLRVREARRRTAMTQEALAARIERTPETISNIERGTQLPSIDTLAELGEVLEVPISEFFEGEGVAPNPLSGKRQELEIRLREIGRTLTDRDLAVLVIQAGAFLDRQ